MRKLLVTNQVRRAGPIVRGGSLSGFLDPSSETRGLICGQQAGFLGQLLRTVGPSSVFTRVLPIVHFHVQSLSSTFLVTL